MICYLFRFIYKDTTLISGIAYNLDKIYRKNSPLYCDDKNVLNQQCFDLDINFYMTTLQYAECCSETEAKKALESLNNGEQIDIQWKVYVSKTYDFDKSQYIRFLMNHLETLRKINHYDKPLHQFLIDNFNAPGNYIFYEEKYKKPDNWNLFDKKTQKKYIERFLHMDKRHSLGPNYSVKVFSGYETEYTDTEIVVRYRISTNKIPYLVASMYNSIVYTSHIINQLSNYKIPIEKNELPFYYALRPLILYYTGERYEKECAFKRN